MLFVSELKHSRKSTAGQRSQSAVVCDQPTTRRDERAGPNTRTIKEKEPARKKFIQIHSLWIVPFVAVEIREILFYAISKKGLSSQPLSADSKNQLEKAIVTSFHYVDSSVLGSNYHHYSSALNKLGTREIRSGVPEKLAYSKHHSTSTVSAHS